MKNNLTPCPFCKWPNISTNVKRRGVYRREGDNYQCVCLKCKARGPLVQNSQEQAESLWNTRP